MNLIEAHLLARHLMDSHNLKGWVFSFNNRKRCFGLCRHRMHTIQLSRHLTLLNNKDSVQDTILHEIAHALTPGHHHDHVWKAMCRALGCSTERCYTEATTCTPKARYSGSCGCGSNLYSRDRLTRNMRLYGKCRRCRQFVEWRVNA